MRFGIRTLSLLLATALFLSVCTTLLSCGGFSSDAKGNSGDQGTQDATPPDDLDTIYIPPAKLYPDRNTIAYSEMVYARPDIDKVVGEINAVTASIEKNQLSYDAQLEAIHGLYEGFSEVLTMYSLINVESYQDGQDAEIAAEYEYITTKYPTFTQAIENLYVAAAASPHKDSFAADYFGAELYDYTDGTDLTDAVVLLMEEEASLEAQYNQLSTSTTITFRGKEDTYENHKSDITQTYVYNSSSYVSAMTELEYAYIEQIEQPIANLYVELIKVRRELADQMGYDTYTEYAFETNGYEYSIEDFRNFLINVRTYAVPVFSDTDLYSAYLLTMQTTSNLAIERHDLVNSLYTLYQMHDDDLADIYRYMLQFGLFDIETAREGRYEGAFTTYFEGYQAPFLFATIDERATDYLTLAHEFGHFADAYLNYNATSSLDLSEIFSQGLEYLTMDLLTEKLDSTTSVYLKYSSLYSALEVMVIQGVYAQFELLVYELETDEITYDKINECAKEAAKLFSFQNYSKFSINDYMIPHTMMYPLYVGSYVTSTVSALEIYLAEVETEGAGFEIYKKLLSYDSEASYTDILTSAGLSNPFRENLIKAVCDEIYFEFLGKHFYETEITDNNIAA